MRTTVRSPRWLRRHSYLWSTGRATASGLNGTSVTATIYKRRRMWRHQKSSGQQWRLTNLPGRQNLPGDTQKHARPRVESVVSVKDE
mmetsp:Transcript_21188/g.30360  ORF Transcript_21188/g.30360 Transcript_21188/m.30360 type:complete len:87 (+) Transcript_21188:485-745(+)